MVSCLPVHYSRHMRYLCLFLVTLMCHPAMAVICKTVSEDGLVSYSDVPIDECADRVKLPESSTYAPRQLPASVLPNQTGVVPGAPFTGYTTMRIEQPKNNGTVRSNEGKVSVSVALQPPLQPGHKLRLALDGVPIQPPFTTLSATLTNVQRGTHSLSADVLDANGRVKRSAGPIRFTLRKEAITPTENTPENPDKPYQPTPVGDAYTPGSADYVPKNQTNYSPPPAPSPATPGKTNPAFAPKYSQ
jgi:hypothetical protein